MAKITFSIDTKLPVEAVLKAATDFTEDRPRYWPNIDPRMYRVHSMSSTTADVTEGSAMFGGIWARESYDWSKTGTVRATVQESNTFRPGGIWQLRATPLPDGGSHIEVVNHRDARGFKGLVIGAILTLMGTRVLPRQLRLTFDILSKETVPAAATP